MTGVGDKAEMMGETEHSMNPASEPGQRGTGVKILSSMGCVEYRIRLGDIQMNVKYTVRYAGPRLRKECRKRLYHYLLSYIL